ncbi:MAG: phosphoenolpyruvate synthase [Veillonella sp.]|jgi:pyruvate,water dikinase|uniref:phosphoenolpyruvate synthase n=1 Tax=Veillonella sp. TaxID=1926307 RepID=UPI001B5EA9DF|nr:phosphoenolpyruvate synthase [Veillonella sp.]MBP6922664.1 phosphoenolpyruvate synthase [Veillonella sp.]NCB95087.1 phosphoenolpyruvate synthase [Negativicutes bacterium]
MNRETAYVLWFDELKREDVALVGGKSSSLGELTSSTSVPVPYGFATTAHGYREFMSKTGLESRIKETLDSLDDVENSALLRDVCAKIRAMICAEEMPADLAEAIRVSYEELGKKVGEKDPFVAVRSSATAEDLPDASFAGQQDTYLNVRGADTIIEKVKECYASTFTDRATYYRVKQGFDHMTVALSAAVQMMVFSKAAGVMFTVDLVTGDDNNILIEGSWGLGEYVVQGTVTPDNFHVNKHDMVITDRMINDKHIRLVRKADGDCIEEVVPADEARAQVLSDAQVLELADYAKQIEKHYGCYMDMEWGIDERDGKLWILQARPETVWSRKEKSDTSAETPSLGDTGNREIVVKGLPASPGNAAGKAHVIIDPSDIDDFKEGEILVTAMTAPDWVPAMKKAKAIVTDAGGMTCHASIVSRELGIPCIVGTKSRSQEATTSIKDGQMITVDATNGIVYDGVIEDVVKKAEQLAAAAVATEYIPVTGTKVYMNLGDPDLAEKYGVLPCDGIGLMREEFIWTTFIHEHPLHLIETGRSDVAVNTLAEGMRKVCQALAPRQVVVRLSDFKSSEYRDLKGGDKYEPHESSALLGWRGASRYYDPKYLPAFKLELEAIKKVRNEYGFKNLQVMIPFCRTVQEAELVTNLMAQEGLVRSADFKIWLMAEIPSNIILADQFNKYVDGYSIGSNDLTMLVLGCDRDNETVQHIYDERNLAVRRAIRHLIEVAHKDGKTVSICGQAPSVYPELCDFLVKSGIDSISVNPDAVKSTKKMVAQLEQRMMLDAVTGRGRQESEDLTW